MARLAYSTSISFFETYNFFDPGYYVHASLWCYWPSLSIATYYYARLPVGLTVNTIRIPHNANQDETQLLHKPFSTSNVHFWS